MGDAVYLNIFSGDAGPPSVTCRPAGPQPSLAPSKPRALTSESSYRHYSTTSTKTATPNHLQHLQDTYVETLFLSRSWSGCNLV